MTPNEYRAAQQSGSSTSQAKVQRLFGLSVLADGLVRLDEFKILAASVIAAANMQAAMLADMFISKRLKTQPLGIGRPWDEAVRLADSMQTIISETEQPLARISRLASSEPLSAAQSASREVLIRQEVQQYIFDVDADACGKCLALANQVFPTNNAAIVHPGCTCLVLPIDTEE